MISFLFWNINKNPVQETIANLAALYDVDVLMLAESDISPTVLIQFLNRSNREYHFLPGFCERIALYSRFSPDSVKSVFESDHVTIRHIAHADFLLAVAHLPSKVHYYAPGTPKSFFWNMFDQVLVRPDLIDKFDLNSLQIVHSDGTTSFLNSQRIPDKKAFSDHLPVHFKLDM